MPRWKKSDLSNPRWTYRRVLLAGGYAQGTKNNFSNPRSRKSMFFCCRRLCPRSKNDYSNPRSKIYILLLPEAMPKVKKKTVQVQYRNSLDVLPPEGGHPENPKNLQWTALNSWVKMVLNNCLFGPPCPWLTWAAQDPQPGRPPHIPP